MPCGKLPEGRRVEQEGERERGKSALRILAMYLPVTSRGCERGGSLQYWRVWAVPRPRMQGGADDRESAGWRGRLSDGLRHCVAERGQAPAIDRSVGDVEGGSEGRSEADQFTWRSVAL